MDVVTDLDAYGPVGWKISIMNDFKSFYRRSEVFISNEEVNTALFHPCVCVACVLTWSALRCFIVVADVCPAFFGEHGFEIREASSLCIQVAAY